MLCFLGCICFIPYGRELPPKFYVSCFYSYYAYFFILHYIYTCMSLYCFHIHAYPISLWFSLILHCLLNSMLQHSLLIRVNSFFYLCYKREFKHANHKALSIKTNTSCMNLMLHYDARRQCVRYNCCSRRFIKTKLTNGINLINSWKHLKLRA